MYICRLLYYNYIFSGFVYEILLTINKLINNKYETNMYQGKIYPFFFLIHN